MCFTRVGVGYWRHHNPLIRQYISTRIQTITHQNYSLHFQHFDFKTTLTESDFQGWGCGSITFAVLILAVLDLVLPYSWFWGIQITFIPVGPRVTRWNKFWSDCSGQRENYSPKNSSNEVKDERIFHSSTDWETHRTLQPKIQVFISYDLWI
jgi:hypothetical protein